MEAECLLFCKCLMLKRKMQTVHKKVEANEYVAAGGLTLTKQYDRYTHTTETRRKIHDDSDSGGSGMAEDDQLTGVALFLCLIMLRVRAAFFFGRLSVCAGSCWPIGRSAEPTQTGREIAAGPPAAHRW